MTDESPMPFGKYQGDKLANVPAWYLINAYEKGWLKWALKKYVEDNMEDLIWEKDRENSRQNYIK